MLYSTDATPSAVLTPATVNIMQGSGVAQVMISLPITQIIVAGSLIEYDGILSFTTPCNKPVWVGTHLRLGSSPTDTGGLELSTQYGFGSNITPEPGEHHKPYYYGSRMTLTKQYSKPFFNFIAAFAWETPGTPNYLTVNPNSGRMAFKVTPPGS